MRLLRADHAPYLLAFFYQVFKERNRVEIEQDRFLVFLRDFQDDLAESGVDVLTRPADHYLGEWVGESARFLRRILAPDDDLWMIELQPETEDALHFVESVIERQNRALGTESRMQMIVEAVRELVLYASGDAEAQIIRLERERDRIDDKIQALRLSNVGEAFDQRQVHERFHLILGMLRELTGDFRAVEEKFRDIVRGMRERERTHEERAGDILAYVLDAEDELQEHPHGASFYAFVKFILSGNQRDDFETLVSELTELDDLRDENEGITRLRRMLPLLTEEATKILSTTQRLSAALRRLLDPRASAEHRQMKNELQEVMRLAAARRDDESISSMAIEIDQGVVIDSPMARTFWTPTEKFQFVSINDTAPEDAEALRRKAREEYALLKRIDWKAMRKKITAALKTSDAVSLEQILADSPLDAGLIEVLGYLQLAHDDHQLIDESSPSLLHVTLDDGSRRLLKLPRVVFRAHQPVS